MENLIYDRAQSDLVQNTSKAYYNNTDLNRVEEWCEYLANLLNSYSYPVNVQVKKIWQISDFSISSEIERIRQNVNRLKQAYFSFTQIPENLEYMTIEKANNIEKILFEIDTILTNMENHFVYSGVANCGQRRLWQQRFRKPKTWISQSYRLLQYADTDTIRMIATNSNEVITKETENLGFPQIDKRDDVYASIMSINESMQILDRLVGA